MSDAIALKLKVARAQLATALDLFIRDKDPFSIQCLACGASEVLDGVAKAKGVAPFSSEVLEQRPHMDEGKLRGIRNQYWNAFKHLKDREDLLRDDEALLLSFDDTKNDAALYVGWHDYASVMGALPVAAPVFQVWWYVLNEEKLGRVDLESLRQRFPGLASVDRKEQKRRLRRSVEKWEKSSTLLDDDRTEKRLHLW